MAKPASNKSSNSKDDALRTQKIDTMTKQLEVLELRARIVDAKVKIAEGQARLKILS